MHVLIFGCPRSGTSILGELFKHIRGLPYWFEKDNLKQIRRMERVVVKNPRFSWRVPSIIKHLPEAKIIYIYRDPRDVVCSLMAGLANRWGHYANDYIKRKLRNIPLLEKCSIFWDYLVSKSLNDLGKHPHIKICYENFVRNTEQEVKKILTYCNINQMNDSIWSYISRVQNQTVNSYHAKKQRKWYRDNHKKRISRYKENLTDKQINTVWNIVKDTAERLGYN